VAGKNVFTMLVIDLIMFEIFSNKNIIRKYHCFIGLCKVYGCEINVDSKIRNKMIFLSFTWIVSMNSEVEESYELVISSLCKAASMIYKDLWIKTHRK
jgi:hypothetical protein